MHGISVVKLLTGKLQPYVRRRPENNVDRRTGEGYPSPEVAKLVNRLELVLHLI
jgi:hypothetical protein